MNYFETIQYIESLAPTLEMPSLEKIRAFLDLYDCPQNKIATLHVGGTNGKGSTVTMLDSILRSAGLKTARFTGPHLLRWNERFHINGLPIADAEFVERASKLRELSEKFGQNHNGPLTWFEFLTALAFFYFAEEKVDVAVFEVGLGGRFDATNTIASPKATGITNVSYDHTHILGDTIEKIAFEKAGIIKSNVPVITAADPPALEIIKNRANQLNAPFYFCAKQIDELQSVQAKNAQLIGLHQHRNFSVALNMLKAASYCPAADVIKKGLEDFYWPGRFQLLADLDLILDGAHNIAGAQALRLSLDEMFPGANFSFIFACYENKDGLAILQALLKTKDRLYLSEPGGSRATFSQAKLAAWAHSMGIETSTHETIAQAFMAASNERKEGEFIVASGSFVTVKEVMIKLGWTSVEDGLSLN